MEKIMKACNLYSVGDLRYEDHPIPVPGTDEVLLQIKAAGICGSDIPRIFEKGTYHFPTIPGHEFAGEIVDAAQEDKNLLGKKVTVFPLLPCGKCAACQTGDYSQCADYDYYGSRRDGAFAEYIAVKKWNLVPVPDAVSFECAALCEPCAVAIHALSQAGISLGDTVVIFGAGPIGLMAAQIAKSWGADIIILADIDEAKLNFARELGFSYTVNSGVNDTTDFVRSIAGQKGADVVLEAAGVSAALEDSLKAAKTFGKVVLMGNPAGKMELSQKAYWEILRKQLTVKGTWNSSYNDSVNDWRMAIRCMERGIIQSEKLITHKFPLADYQKAFELARRKNEFSVKIMFTF